jgi:Leucine-rich repeat (LRR) protein
LRNNQISRIDSGLPTSLVKLDLYDNLIHRIQNLETLDNLTSLDLSYNKIKHIKGVKHLKKLRELYFAQNSISRIEELDGLVNLISLELGANRIRVTSFLEAKLIVKEITGLETLTSLQELFLGKNKITQLKVSFILLMLLKKQGTRQLVFITAVGPTVESTDRNPPDRIIQSS